MADTSAAGWEMRADAFAASTRPSAASRETDSVPSADSRATIERRASATGVSGDFAFMGQYFQTPCPGGKSGSRSDVAYLVAELLQDLGPYLGELARGQEAMLSVGVL